MSDNIIRYLKLRYKAAINKSKEIFCVCKYYIMFTSKYGNEITVK